MATNALGFISKEVDVDILTANNRPMSLVVVGDTLAMDAKESESPSVTRGALGTHSLYVPGTTIPLVLPTGYTIYRTDVRVVNALVGVGGKLSLGVGSTTAGIVCLNDAEGVANWAASDALITGNVSDNRAVTSGEIATYTVTDAALTGGRLMVYLNMFTSA